MVQLSNNQTFTYQVTLDQVKHLKSSKDFSSWDYRELAAAIVGLQVIKKPVAAKLFKDQYNLRIIDVDEKGNIFLVKVPDFVITTFK
jgi:hypothetical protein